MTHEYTRREVDYQVFLTEKAREWEAQHRALAAEIRLTVQRSLGMHVPPSTRTGQLLLEQAFREQVRARENWPDARSWMRGEG
jgi:hypothetical protein